MARILFWNFSTPKFFSWVVFLIFSISELMFSIVFFISEISFSLPIFVLVRRVFLHRFIVVSSFW